MAGIRGDDEGEPLVGQEAMRLGTSFFMFGMLIGEHSTRLGLRHSI
jgi:hypothetical protein